MTDDQRVRTDPWLRALGPGRSVRSVPRRSRPAPGRHRLELTRDDPWQRALTGPPIGPSQRVS